MFPSQHNIPNIDATLGQTPAQHVQCLPVFKVPPLVWSNSMMTQASPAVSMRWSIGHHQFLIFLPLVHWSVPRKCVRDEKSKFGEHCRGRNLHFGSSIWFHFYGAEDVCVLHPQGPSMLRVWDGRRCPRKKKKENREGGNRVGYTVWQRVIARTHITQDQPGQPLCVPPYKLDVVYVLGRTRSYTHSKLGIQPKLCVRTM